LTNPVFAIHPYLQHLLQLYINGPDNLKMAIICLIYKYF
jgi:hypothetical protein